MSQINIDDVDRDWFDSFKDSDETQSEAFHRMRKQAQAYNGEVVDVSELADELAHTLIPQTEVAAYRGTLEAVEGNNAE